MKSQELSKFFSLIGQAKKEKEEEFDNLLKEANVDLESMATSLFTGIESAKVEVKEQKKKEEKLIESLDTLLVSLEKPKETTPVVLGVPDDFDISSLEKEIEEEVVEEEVVEETVEEDDTISKAIKFIDTQLKKELKDIEPNDPTVDSIKAEVKELRNILYKVLAHGPGSGEVRVLRMDDVDTDDLANGRVLSYDSSSEKLKFVDQSGGGNTGYANTAGISTFAISAGVATNSTQLNGQVASYYLDYDNFTNTPTIPTNNNQLTNGAGFITNSVSGNFTVSGNVSIGGTLTYEDVTNIDSVGLITARSGVEVGSGTTLSPEGNGFFVGVVTATSFVGNLTGNADTATNSTQLNSQAASYYLDYDNFTNTPISSVTATTTTTSQTAVDTFAAATYRSVKYQIQIARGSEYHITEVFIVHDGTTSYGTEYATIKTGSLLASFDTDINSGNVRLLVTPTSSSSTVFKLIRTLIKV